MARSRNVQGKPGNKGYTATEREADADRLKLQEQWDFYYQEWVLLCRAVKRHGRVYTDRFDQPKDRPEVGMRDRAAAHLLAISKTLASLGVLEPEQERELGVVLDFQKKAQAK